MTAATRTKTGRVIPATPVTPFWGNRCEMGERGFPEREVIDFDSLLTSTIGMTGMTGMTKLVFMSLYSVTPLDVCSW